MDLDLLHDIACAATPGPWHLECMAKNEYYPENKCHAHQVHIGEPLGPPDNPAPTWSPITAEQSNWSSDDHNNHLFISTFNPNVVLEMINRLRALR